MKIISDAKDINDSTRLHIFSDWANIDLETMLHLCPDRICDQCGNDHDFNPSFDGGVRPFTSICSFGLIENRKLVL